MALTIDKPETEARLIRFATIRGISVLEALEILLDEEGAALEGIPDVLLYPSPTALKDALADLEAGEGIDGEAFLAELRAPLETLP